MLISYRTDDFCLISLSTAGMQTLLNICEEFSIQHELIFNSSKTKCMYFKPKYHKLKHLPTLTIGGLDIMYVDKCKYLGTFIEDGLTDSDVKRQMRKFYANANLLLRKFNCCSYDVKCMLFKTFCANVYCAQFWYMSSATSIRKLKVSYNNSLRRLMNLPKWNSASEMFVSLNILSFDELLRKTIYGFIQRLRGAENEIISTIVSSSVPLSSKIWGWWQAVLHSTAQRT